MESADNQGVTLSQPGEYYHKYEEPIEDYEHQVAPGVNGSFQPDSHHHQAHIPYPADMMNQPQHQTWQNQPHQAPFSAVAPNTGVAQSPAAAMQTQNGGLCTPAPSLSIELLIKIAKTGCFLIMIICSSVALSHLKIKYVPWGARTAKRHASYGIAASVIGFILEGVSLFLLLAGILSKLVSPKPPVPLLVVNILSMILYFTSIIILTNDILGSTIAGYTAFASLGLAAGAVELYTQIKALRGDTNQQ